MIDLHCHLLHSMDDGSDSIETSIKMCEIAYKDGIRKIVATPHFNEIWKPTLGMIEKKIKEIKEKLNFQLSIFPGSDITLFYGIYELIKEKKVIPLNLTKYLLIQLPHIFDPRVIENLIFQIQLEGFSVIISHPERQSFFMENPSFLKELIKRGCLVQITAGSITGKFGKKIQKFTKYLLRNDLVHIIATDAHSDKYRKPVLSESVEITRKWIGNRAEEMVSTFPEKILNGEEI